MILQTNMKALLLVGAGGFAGSALRYLISRLMLPWAVSSGFPFSTLTVNVAGSLLIGAVIAAIIALAVVGGLKGQLRQAAQQSAAAGYIREGSFRLDVNFDHFLYESTTRRKIEDDTQKK